MNKKDLIFELDYNIGGLSSRASLMRGIETELGVLSTEMDNTDMDDARLRLYNWRRKVRLLSELMNYATNDLERDYNRIHGDSQILFDEIVKGLNEDE